MDCLCDETNQTPGPVLNRRTLLAGAFTGVALAGANIPAASAAPIKVASVSSVDPAKVIKALTGRRVTTWGMAMPGIMSKAPWSTAKVAGKTRPCGYLTFDACGNPGASSGYDKDLINFLRARKIPATLFISQQWAVANPKIALELSKDPLFEIGNHGTRHLPLSTTGRAAYDIRGTRNVGDAAKEVWDNTIHQQKVLGRRPTLFRSGTAHYDNVAVDVVRALGQLPVGFTVNVDAGATASRSNIAKALRTMPAGAITLAHFNRPGGSTNEGHRDALDQMLKAGWVFRKMSDGFPR